MKMIFVAILFLSSISFAKDSAKDEKAKADKESQHATAYSKTENELGQFENKIKTNKLKIIDLLKEKNKSLDKQRIQDITKEVQELLKEVRKDSINANKLIHKLKYEMPRKGSDKQMKYKRYDEKAIKDFEDEVNKQLSDVLSDLKKKYK